MEKNTVLETKKVKLSKGAKVLILDQGISKIISIFLNTFLAAYFYKISEQNIFYLSTYNIISWIVATIAAFMVADRIKRKNKINLYRFGTVLEVLYIFMIIVMKEKIVDYVWIMGIVVGVCTATTGFPFNMIESELISNDERSKYLGYKSAGTELVGVLVPVLLGAYITFYSYEVAAILILIFAILKLILSFYIQNQNVQADKVNLKKFWEILKQDLTLRKLYAIEFLKGFNRHGVMSLVVSLLIIYQTNSDLELGKWTSFFSLLTIIAMYLFGNYYNKSKKNKTLLFSAIPVLLSFIGIFFSINMTTVILYNMSYYVFMNIILNVTDKDLFDYSNRELFKDKFNTEYFVFRELFLNIGRTLGYIMLLLFVGIPQNLGALNVLFAIIAISIILTIIMSKNLKGDRNAN